MYKVGCQGYDKKNDTWKPITHLPMVKAFKESHTKDLEKLAADRRREAYTSNDKFSKERHLSLMGWTSTIFPAQRPSERVFHLCHTRKSSFCNAR
jgi:hypothetical protein